MNASDRGMHGENAKWSDGVFLMSYLRDALWADLYKECQPNTFNMYGFGSETALNTPLLEFQLFSLPDKRGREVVVVTSKYDR